MPLFMRFVAQAAAIYWIPIRLPAQTSAPRSWSPAPRISGTCSSLTCRRQIKEATSAGLNHALRGIALLFSRHLSLFRAFN